jgi:hypothetical protein
LYRCRCRCGCGIHVVIEVPPTRIFVYGCGRRLRGLRGLRGCGFIVETPPIGIVVHGVHHDRDRHNFRLRRRWCIGFLRQLDLLDRHLGPGFE